MHASAALLALAPGLALGSFLNVVAARLPRGRSLARPGSACVSCEAPVAWYDNVPLVSYVLLRGRCRACGVRISALYPAIELATALLVAGCFLRFGLSGRAFVGAFFCAALVALSAIDFERRILPDRIVLPSTVIVLAAQIALFPDRALEWAGGDPLVFGGDLNLRPPRTPRPFERLVEDFGLAPAATGKGIDHLFARGLEVVETPAPLAPEERDVPGPAGRRIRLSDHAPVAGSFGLRRT